MKTITSSNGVEIEFSISSTRKIIIGSNPVKVTDLELRVLQERLGSQITIVGESEPEKTSVSADPEEKESKIEPEGSKEEEEKSEA